MKKLFLSSSFAQVEDQFATFLGADCAGKTVTFIPTASLAESVDFYVEQGRQTLQRQGLVVHELEISTATPEQIAKTLRDNDYIYLTGGNTFFLLQALRSTGAAERLIEQVEAGKPCMGESAGAMVLAPDIEYVRALDDTTAAPGLDSFESLGLIDFYPVPHHTNAPFAEAVEQIISTHGQTLRLRPMSNTQAIIVEDDRALSGQRALVSDRA